MYSCEYEGADRNIREVLVRSGGSAVPKPELNGGLWARSKHLLYRFVLLRCKICTRLTSSAKCHSACHGFCGFCCVRNRFRDRKHEWLMLSERSNSSQLNALGWRVGSGQLPTRSHRYMRLDNQPSHKSSVHHVRLLVATRVNVDPVENEAEEIPWISHAATVYPPSQGGKLHERAPAE